MLVKFYATCRQITGCASCDIPAPDDVLALLEELSERWPDLRGFLLSADGTDSSDYVAILVSGKYIESLNGVSTKLTEEDSVSLTPVVSGG